MVECNLAKVDVEGSNPFSRSVSSIASSWWPSTRRSSCPPVASSPARRTRLQRTADTCTSYLVSNTPRPGEGAQGDIRAQVRTPRASRGRSPRAGRPARTRSSPRSTCTWRPRRRDSRTARRRTSQGTSRGWDLAGIRSESPAGAPRSRPRRCTRRRCRKRRPICRRTHRRALRRCMRSRGRALWWGTPRSTRLVRRRGRGGSMRPTPRLTRHSLGLRASPSRPTRAPPRGATAPTQHRSRRETRHSPTRQP